MTISNQKFFDKVKKHLLKQGRKCKSATAVGLNVSACMYYNPADGTRCAIGGALPMRVIKMLIAKGLNHAGISEITSFDGVKECLPDDFGLVADLQDCHDAVPTIGWEVQLKIIATEYHLEYEGAKK